MTINKFLDLLAEFYYEVPNTGFACKFYAQATSFSFEIHDKTKIHFTPDSCQFQSDVYGYWMEPQLVEERRRIFDDILEAVNRCVIKKELKIIIER